LDAQSLLKDAEVTKMRLNQAVLYLILFFWQRLVQELKAIQH
jgi:hypothetical protein